MRKLIITFFAVFLILLSSCDNPDINNSGTENIVPDDILDSSESNTEAPVIHQGFEYTVHEIPLPEEGETIEYEPAFNIFTDESGKKIEALSASRNGKTISFYTNETDYYFDPLGITILTSSGELFISMNGVKQDDGTNKYEITQYEATSDTDETLKAASEMRAFLGDNYDSAKNYYYVVFCNIVDSD